VTSRLTGGGGRDPFEWFLDMCVMLFAGVLALTAAVRLLDAIWPALAIVAGCVAGIVAIVVVVRWWLGRW
jgi:undecaprenyl pyrophosphate phosphatase UppP